jgi:DUF1365 family protein
MHSALYTGRLRHRRYSPHSHAFSYTVYMVWLDLSELDCVFQGRWLWSARSPALAWFRRADYLGDTAIPLEEAVRRFVKEQSGRRPVGPVRILTQLRNFGHCFNPVTFYYCYDASGEQVEVVVAEITNTPWRERHAYVLPASARNTSGVALHFDFAKQFHVSPFMPMDLHYHWRFTEPGERLAVHMDNLQDGTRVFSATLELRRREITGASLAGVLLRFPASTLRVLVAIHWQALRLWLKRVRYHAHPAAGGVSGR